MDFLIHTKKRNVYTILATNHKDILARSVKTEEWQLPSQDDVKATGWRQGIAVRFPLWLRGLSLLLSVQTHSGVHRGLYPCKWSIRSARLTIHLSTEAGIEYFFNHSIETLLGPTKPSSVRVLNNRPQVVKHPTTEATHSSTFRAQVKSAWSYAPISSYVSLAWSLDTDFRIRIYLRVGS